MKLFISRLTRTAALALACTFGSAAYATSTTNYTDQWGNFSENGWGISVLQQADILFVDMFVFGADSKPTWFVVAAPFQNFTDAGHLVFSGDLFAGTGPYYALPTFNPANVVGGKVGTFKFDSDSINTATITYTVGGITVVKNVQRTYLATEDFSGDFYGGLVYDASGCGTGNDGRFQELGDLTVTQSSGANPTLTLLSTPAAGGTCTYIGAYSQSGHMGGVTGTYSCSGGQNGTFNMFEMERNISGMTGRFTSQAGACALEGRFGGVSLN